MILIRVVFARRRVLKIRPYLYIYNNIRHFSQPIAGVFYTRTVRLSLAIDVYFADELRNKSAYKELFTMLMNLNQENKSKSTRPQCVRKKKPQFRFPLPSSDRSRTVLHDNIIIWSKLKFFLFNLFQVRANPVNFQQSRK